MNIGVIGYGNVEQHLVAAIKQLSDHSISVFNRSPITDDRKIEDVQYCNQLSELTSLDLVIISVKDDAIIEIMERIENIIPQHVVVCHCSGSIPASVIEPYFSNYGVLYPLQTFSKDKKIDYTEIPFFITSHSDNTEKTLFRLAQSLSEKVEVISDQQRLSMHIAAVFACNYVNAMYSISHKLCNDFSISFDVLKPLILETAQKVQSLPPANAQTGPAIRRDWEIVYQHEEFLNNYDNQIGKIYRQMADFITKNM